MSPQVFGNARLHGLRHRGGEVAATLDLPDASHELSYRFAGVEPDERYDPFVVAALPIAMRCRAHLEAPEPISPKLLASLPEAQRILNSWYPELERVEVRGADGSIPAAEGSRGVACFFSGGVDSFYTVLRHRDRIDALVHVHGFDVALADRERDEQIRVGLRQAASELGLPLVEVDTPLRLVSNRYAPWGTHYNGVALASVALLLGRRFREVLIPASHSFRDLLPWGSHVLLDPLWSTESLTVTHEGAVPRPDKIRSIARSDVAMRHLRVCYRRGVPDLNCGRCGKCTRTMAVLRLEGALERCATFPNRVPLARIAVNPAHGGHARERTREHLAAARAAGDRRVAAAFYGRALLGPPRARFDDAREAARRSARWRSRPLRRRVRRARRRARRLRKRMARWR